MDFEYDPQKSESNKIKHGIDFEEAQSLWNDLEAIEILLPFPTEPRFMVIAIIDGQYWSATITYRGARIRIISVRRSRIEERDLYEDSRRV